MGVQCDVTAVGDNVIWLKKIFKFPIICHFELNYTTFYMILSM